MPERTFGHAPDLRDAFPELVAGAIRVDGITADPDTVALAAPFLATARTRLAGGTESDLPEIKSWRAAFSRMGLKPTQYRCASEALLRRLRTEDTLPALHPLVDLANAVSVAFALPVAVFDLDRVSGSLEVRFADGTERYETFGGDVESPAFGEVVFRDDDGWAHARRWTNRQSGRSAVRTDTSRVLIVSEGMHASAGDDVPRLIATLSGLVGEAWSVRTGSAVLTREAPRFVL